MGKSTLGNYTNESGIELNTVEIYFKDLTPDAQKRVMEAMEIIDPSEGNFEFVPLMTLEFEVEPFPYLEENGN